MNSIDINENTSNPNQKVLCTSIYCNQENIDGTLFSEERLRDDFYKLSENRDEIVESERCQLIHQFLTIEFYVKMFKKIEKMTVSNGQ